ncbi:MAG: hypothetical protein ACRCY9_16440, partial [Phycicoccus sp.]
ANGHLRVGELELDPDTGLWFDEDGMFVDAFGEPLDIDKESGLPVDDVTGALIDPETGQLVGADGTPLELTDDGLVRLSDDRLVDPATGLGYDATTGALVDAEGRPLPVDPASGLPRDNVTGALIDPKTGQFVGADGEPLAYTGDGRLIADDGTLIDPDTGERRDPDTGAVLDRPAEKSGEPVPVPPQEQPSGDGKTDAKTDADPKADPKADAKGDADPDAGARDDDDKLQVTTRTEDGEVTEVEVRSGEDDVTIRLADDLTDGRGVDAHLDVEIGRDGDGDGTVTVTVDLDDPVAAGTNGRTDRPLESVAAGRRERQDVGV